MNGIFYSRIDGEFEEIWNYGEVVISYHDFKKFFPEMPISGSWEHDENCEGGDDCYCTHNVRLTAEIDKEINEMTLSAEHTKDIVSHAIKIFKWKWSGHGATEHWFDDKAICLTVKSKYRSNSGLTADTTRIVAYKRHVEVASFRGDCAGSAGKPKIDKIWAEFVNSKGGYRANWTGFAVGTVGTDPWYDDWGKKRFSDTLTVIGDLDIVIESILADNVGKPTVCKHNQQIKACIITDDKTKIPRYLCTACRLQGVQWSEFTGRNRQDICPYFRRACKAVTTRSDQLPEWFEWEGDNLLSSHRRLQDGEWEAYEVVYVRRKEGFIRRAVWLGNTRTQEVWMYPYAGFIPKAMADFREKYLPKNSRQIRGYLGANPPGHRDGGDVTEDDFRSAAKQEPLWSVNGVALLPFGRGFPPGYKIEAGNIGNISVISRKKETGEIADDVKPAENPKPVYADDRYLYYGLGVFWSYYQSIIVDGQELGKTEGGKNYLLRVFKK